MGELKEASKLLTSQPHRILARHKTGIARVTAKITQNFHRA
jgi:hypothetical protein